MVGLSDHVRIGKTNVSRLARRGQAHGFPDRRVVSQLMHPQADDLLLLHCHFLPEKLTLKP
jgi:hypothetical protein